MRGEEERESERERKCACACVCVRKRDSKKRGIFERGKLERIEDREKNEERSRKTNRQETRATKQRTSEGTKVLNRPWQRNCSFISIKQEVRKFNYRC